MDGDFRQAEVNVKSSIDKSIHHHYSLGERVEVDTEAARARLAELPLDALPAVSALPPGSHMPLLHNPAFVGRADDLKALAALLKSGESARIGQVAAVTGLGGIGKTQLATEFVHRYGTFFAGGVYWLSFADPSAIEAEIAACGGPRGMNLSPAFSSLPQTDQVAMVHAEWERDIPRLLVFDNCEDPELVQHYRPISGAARVLVTSRRTEWPATAGISSLTLGVLSRTESVALLQHFRPDIAAEDPALAAIAEALGDLPLALHLAGSFLHRYRHSDHGQPDAYLAALSRPELLSHRSLTTAEGTPTEHDPNVARTFALSYERLDSGDTTDAAALDLLSRAACFAPGEPIPRALLVKSWGADDEPAEDSALLAEDALRRLHDLGLLAMEHDGAVVLHRLLAAYIHATAENGAAARQAVEVAVADEAIAISNSGLPAALLEWRPHLSFVAERAAEEHSKQAARLLTALGYHLQMVADYTSARDAYQQALAIDEAAFGPDHPNVALRVNNLGRVHHDLGDLPAARDAFQRALAIDEAALGAHHPNVATRVNNLGSVLGDLGDLPAARDAFQRALAIDEAVFGPDHPPMAGVICNLGHLLHNGLHDLPAAHDAYQRALAIDEANLGPNHPNVARDVHKLGTVLHDLGDLPGAREAFQRALAIDEAAFGPDHPEVATNVNSLARVLRDFGDLHAARDAVQRALAIDEATFRPEHPKVARDVHTMGTVLHDLGDLHAARDAVQRALAIDEATLGPEHPNVATLANNLGLVLQDLGDLPAARDAFQQALAIFERVFGSEHHDTLTVRNNLHSIPACLR